MRNRTDCLKQIKVCIVELSETEKKYEDLDQISMQSETGYFLRNKINNLKGRLESLYWVTNLS